MGVDIFFVISGFLMTGIIVKGLEAGGFSIWQFYMARVRRIAPALMVLLASLLILGWFWLPTQDYQSLGAQSAYSLAFLSNIHFWRSAGYFDTLAQEKWLLHTWSLGVEFQFYLLFPIFLIILWKIKPQIKTFFWGLGLAIIASLLLSIVISYLKPVAAFYLLPTRGWELGVGGLAFLIGREVPSLQRFAKPMFWLGFSFWGLAAFLIDNRLPWPSAWALLPVTGTFLIILAVQANSKLMLNPLAQWLGDRSYSLYLWHWPLVVILYFAGLQNEWLWITGAFALSLLLGHLSYWLVETPTRIYLTRSSFFKQVVFLFFVGLLVGLAAVSVKLFSYENRLPKEASSIVPIHGENHAKDCLVDNHQNCFFNTDSDKKSLIIGDSHAGSVFNAFGLASQNSGYSPRILNQGGCPMIENIKFTSFGMEKNRPKSTCKKYFDNLHEVLKNKVMNKVIIVNRMQYYFNGPNELSRKEFHGLPLVYTDKVFDQFNDDYYKSLSDSYVKTLCKLSKLSDEVYVTRPIPEMEVEVAKTLYKNNRFGLTNKEIKVDKLKYFDRNKLVWDSQNKAAKQCNIKLLDPTQYLCDEQYCYGSKNIKPLYNDNNHLNDYGAEFLIEMFSEALQ